MTRNFADFGEIIEVSACLIENLGVGVTTTLGPGDFFSPKGCYLDSDHHRGREFPCVVGISVSRIFRGVKTHRFGNSLPFGIWAGGGRAGANLWVRNNPYLSY